MERTPIIQKLFNCAKLNPNKVAIYTAKQTFTYSEMWSCIRKYALYLRESGVNKHDRIVFKASQTVEFAIIYFAIHLVGATAVSLEKTTPNEKVIDIKSQLNATHVIDDVVGDLKRNEILDLISGIDDECAEFTFPSLSDSADILFTTGTTGISKGVELSHLALVATAENLICGCGYKENTMIVVPGPLNHANAIRKLFTSMYNGSSIYILPGFTDVAGFFRALSVRNVCVACCLPPAAIRAIFTISKDKIGDYKNIIDFIESASAPLPEVDKVRLHELLPNTRLYNNYGSSESASVCMYDYSKHLDLKGCIGKPAVNAKILIVDDNRKVIDSSEDNLGYISSKGDMNMIGYVNEPELTKEVLNDGIVYTNDLGYIKNGFVFIVGRKGDVINVGGLKVTPIEVESAALAYPGIDDCICVPVNDQITGCALKLLFVSKTDINIQSFASFLSKKLEGYKVPRYFEKTEKIARTYNGKLDRKHYIQ